MGFYIHIIIIVVALTGCLSSVKDNENKTKIDKERIQEVLTDSSFLEIKGDILMYPELLWANQEIYLKALNRLESRVKVKDNQLVWDFKSAKEMRMSQNLYDYIVGRWERYNKRLLCGKEEIYVTRMGHYALRWIGE